METKIKVWIRECDGVTEETTTKSFDSNAEAVEYLTPEGHDVDQEGEWQEEGYVYTHEGKTYTILHVEYEITDEMTIAYLTGDPRNVFGLYRDGSFAVGESVGMEIAEEERPILTLKCLGIANMDLTHYTKGWAVWDTETQDYVVTETGEHISEEEAIARCVTEGDGSENVELSQKLVEAGR